MSYHIHQTENEVDIKTMSRNEVMNFPTLPWVNEGDMANALERGKTRMQIAGVWNENQILGRRYSIGCVALEITQRCNLDCTLCYLSESSESVKDIPMEEIFKRIDQIKYQFGPKTDVQITGGDPTLRKRSELMEIVRRIRDIGLRPTLMTNGIAATRDLVTELVHNGLNDIAIHVDLTQERKGFKTEVEMNKIRLDYIERVRGLPLAVIFNTTVFAGNFNEIPDLIRFFKQHADVVGMASFQLQADTGRGELRKRDQIISLQTVADQIEKGAETKIAFDIAKIGHPRCHFYGITMEANHRLYNFFDTEDTFKLLMDKTKGLELDRARPKMAALKILAWAVKNPSIILPGLKFIGGKLWQMKKDIVLGGGKIHKFSFFIQNFMDAESLELDRVHACSFMVMTSTGPISMCMHNAKRDSFILQPLKLKDETVWQPLTGKSEQAEPAEQIEQAKEPVMAAGGCCGSKDSGCHT